MKNLPFPFKNVHEFEKSIRQPIGKHWNTETSFKDLIKPKVGHMTYALESGQRRSESSVVDSGFR